MIKLKHLIREENDRDHKAWRKDWLERHNATFDERGRLIAYHGTPKRNLKSIKNNGFRQGSYFSLKQEYSKRIAVAYHETPETPESDIIVLQVKLPMDAIDFVASDIVATRPIQFSEVI